MKPVVQDYEVVISHDHEVVDMSMDENSLVHLMNQYIDLYKDVLTAILREYGTNAWDSHREAGISDPIEVRLPDQWEPILRIEDHGVGLSKQELKDIYSKYGASTKRESNEVVGMLGLGCKSGLAYTQQFTIIAVKDGMQTTVLVSRNAQGAGSLHFMDHSPTDKPNGVKVSIPIRKEDHDQLRLRAYNLYQFWPEGSVLIDGVAPEPIKAEPIVGNIYMRAGTTQSYVVMGNVPYPVDASELGLDLECEYDHSQKSYGNRHDYNSAVLAFLPIGAVEPHQSREFLRPTDENKAVLAEVGRQFAEVVSQRALDDIDQAPTKPEAVLRMHKWRYQLPKSMLPIQIDSHGRQRQVWTYRGEEIPMTFQGEPDLVTDGTGRYATSKARGFMVKGRGSSKSPDRHKQIVSATGVRAVWLYGFNIRWTAKHADKLKLWAENRGLETDTFVLTNRHPETADYWPWIRQDKVFSFEEVRNTRLPRATPVAAPAAYETLTFTAKQEPAWYNTGEIHPDNLDPNKPIYYFAGEQGRRSQRSYWSRSNRSETRAERAEPYAQLMWALDPDIQIVLIPQTRVAKLQREFPHAKDIETAAREKFNRWKGGLSADTKAALGQARAGERRLFRKLDPAKIDDPAIVEAIRISKIGIKEQSERQEFFRKALTTADFPWEDPLASYHLKITDDRDPTDEMLEHYYIYLNGVYAVTNRPEAQLHAA